MEDQVQDQGKKINELEEIKNQCEQYLDGWKRAKADLINYKKEESERLGEIAKYARQNYIYQLLPIVDNFSLTASQMAPELLENNHVKGLLMIKLQLEDFLKANGVEAVKSVGEKFDPNVHEVIQAVEAEGEESGIVIEEVRAGYKIDGNLLRPAKVKVVK